MPSNNICLNSNPPQFASMTAWMMSAISILKISSSPGLLAGKKPQANPNNRWKILNERKSDIGTKSKFNLADRGLSTTPMVCLGPTALSTRWSLPRWGENKDTSTFNCRASSWWWQETTYSVSQKWLLAIFPHLQFLWYLEAARLSLLQRALYWKSPTQDVLTVEVYSLQFGFGLSLL